MVKQIYVFVLFVDICYVYWKKHTRIIQHVVHADRKF